jgi:hypothetical protein
MLHEDAINKHRFAWLALEAMENPTDEKLTDAVQNETDKLFALAETPPRGSDAILRYTLAYIETVDPTDDRHSALAMAVEAFLSERKIAA